MTFWKDWLSQIVSSTLYVVNWQLASDSVNYLAADNAASPVQHYWSLSAEEQFYIAWPLLILLCVFVANKIAPKIQKIAIISGLALIICISLGYSVYATATSPQAAYFVTTTRAWEFGFGGLLSFLPELKNRLPKITVAWIGVLGVLIVTFAYSGTTPFPGIAALLPVLSAGFIIWGGSDSSRISFSHLSNVKPVQYLGDISYSLYLWHWPPIVILPYILGRDLRLLDKIALLVGCVVLATLTKKFVEDPARSMSALVSRPPRITLFSTAAATVLALIAPTAGLAWVGIDQKSATLQAESFDATAQCAGANAVLNDGCALNSDAEMIPALSAIRNDMEMTDCNSGNPASDGIVTCHFGASDPSLRIAITGDSHARQLAPAFLPVLDEKGWSLDTYFSRGCLWGNPSPSSPECDEYRSTLDETLINGNYDVIIVTGFRGTETTAESAESLTQMRKPHWEAARDSGAKIIIIGDNPRVPASMTDCVINNPELAHQADACVLPPDSDVEPIDPYRYAAISDPSLGFIDMNDAYCTADGCPMVIGDVVVYRDGHHLTATYVRTLAATLVARFEEALMLLPTP